MDESKDLELYEKFEGLAISLAVKFWRQYQDSIRSFMDYEDLVQEAKLYLWQCILRVDRDKYAENQIPSYCWISVNWYLLSVCKRQLPPNGVYVDAWDPSSVTTWEDFNTTLPEDLSYSEEFNTDFYKILATSPEKAVLFIMRELLTPEKLARKLVKTALKFMQEDRLGGKNS